MAGALRKTMVYLGLAEDELGYDEYDEYDEHGATPSRLARHGEPRRGDADAAARPPVPGQQRRRAVPDHHDPPADVQRGQDHRRALPRRHRR